jgi:hypothetical protein
MSDTKQPTDRDAKGKYVAGHAPTGGGRRKLREDVRDMLEAATPKAAQRVIEALDAERPVVVGNGPHAHVELHPDHDVRLKAYHAIFDRLHGKPAQEVTGADGGPLFGAVAKETLEAIQELAKDRE